MRIQSVSQGASSHVHGANVERSDQQAGPNHSASTRDLSALVIDPFALFGRSSDIAQAYENWLKAQADLFLALHVFSVASLDLFKAMSGKQAARSVGLGQQAPIRPTKRKGLR